MSVSASILSVLRSYAILRLPYYKVCCLVSFHLTIQPLCEQILIVELDAKDIFNYRVQSAYPIEALFVNRGLKIESNNYKKLSCFWHVKPLIPDQS